MYDVVNRVIFKIGQKTLTAVRLAVIPPVTNSVLGERSFQSLPHSVKYAMIKIESLI